MAALTSNVHISEKLSGRLLRMRVAPGKHCYKGGFAGMKPDGTVQPFQPGDVLIGFFEKEADNTDGVSTDPPLYMDDAFQSSVVNSVAAGSGSASGLASLKVTKQTVASVIIGDHATDLYFAISGAALTDIGRWVYATTDNPADVSYSGHPDAAIGRVQALVASGSVRIRMKRYGEVPQNGRDSGSIVIESDFTENVAGPGATTAGTIAAGSGTGGTGVLAPGLFARSMGAAGTHSVGQLALVDGILQLLLSSTSENGCAGIETAIIGLGNGGITAECDVSPHVLANATDEIYFGLADLTSHLFTDTFRKNPEATTSGNVAALFSVVGGTSPFKINAYTDDNTTVTSDTDTTKTVATDANVRLRIIIRVSGAVEFWINGVQVLATTTFSIKGGNTLSSLLFGMFLICAKASGTGVPDVRPDRVRFGCSR